MSKVFHIKNQPLLRTYLTWDLDFKFTCSYDDFFQGNQTNPFFIALIQQMVYLSFFIKKSNLHFGFPRVLKFCCRLSSTSRCLLGSNAFQIWPWWLGSGDLVSMSVVCLFVSLPCLCVFAELGTQPARAQHQKIFYGPLLSPR